MYFVRTENGAAANVNKADALAEINKCMMDDKREVAEMTSVYGYTLINYKDGRKVELSRQDGDMPEPVKAGTVKVKRDTMVPVGPHTMLATLATGRTYIVWAKPRRKHPRNECGVSGNADFTSYWTEKDGRPFGATRIASELDKPGGVGGRIWTLLLEAGIA